MADKDYKAFIVEGEAREPLIIENISKVFFQASYSIAIILRIDYKNLVVANHDGIRL